MQIRSESKETISLSSIFSFLLQVDTSVVPDEARMKPLQRKMYGVKSLSKTSSEIRRGSTADLQIAIPSSHMQIGTTRQDFQEPASRKPLQVSRPVTICRNLIQRIPSISTVSTLHLHGDVAAGSIPISCKRLFGHCGDDLLNGDRVDKKFKRSRFFIAYQHAKGVDLIGH